MAENADEDSSTGIDLICALCDNGGEIPSCEGKCLRSFHATKDAGEDCKTLGYTRDQFDVMKVFLCKNCQYDQCFACQRLGSAKTDPPEVFRCASASCGHFYHAKCVAQLLFPENESKATEYATRIINGAKFACPIHRCDVCKYGENKEVSELQFAVCRRCPKSYHRRCLPRKIALDDIVENGICLLQRAWDGLLPNNRILIYCLKHYIDPKLRTALTYHIKFPADPSITKKSSNVNGMKKFKIRRLEDCLDVPSSSSKGPCGTTTCSSCISLMATKKKVPVSGGIINENLLLIPDMAQNAAEDSYTGIDFCALCDNGGEIASCEGKCLRLFHATKDAGEDCKTLGYTRDQFDAMKVFLCKKCEYERYQCFACQRFGSAKADPPEVFLCASASCGHFYHAKCVTQLLSENEPKATEYTTRVVDKLQWYIQNGDTVFDVFCGSNDFSTLLKEKLEDSENKSYKNYDPIQPKNFSIKKCLWRMISLFERRGWITVQPDELPAGSRLIMGLNHPFEFKASLANQFISEAPSFKPKLIILIVPKHTKRCKLLETIHCQTCSLNDFAHHFFHDLPLTLPSNDPPGRSKTLQVDTDEATDRKTCPSEQPSDFNSLLVESASTSVDSQIFVKSLLGTLSVQINLEKTSQDLIDLIAQRTHFNPVDHYAEFRGCVLVLLSKLKDQGILNDSTVTIRSRLGGGLVRLSEFPFALEALERTLMPDLNEHEPEITFKGSRITRNLIKLVTDSLDAGLYWPEALGFDDFLVDEEGRVYADRAPVPIPVAHLEAEHRIPAALDDAIRWHFDSCIRSNMTDLAHSIEHYFRFEGRLPAYMDDLVDKLLNCRLRGGQFEVKYKQKLLIHFGGLPSVCRVNIIHQVKLLLDSLDELDKQDFWRAVEFSDIYGDWYHRAESNWVVNETLSKRTYGHDKESAFHLCRNYFTHSFGNSWIGSFRFYQSGTGLEILLSHCVGNFLVEVIENLIEIGFDIFNLLLLCCPHLY